MPVRSFHIEDLLNYRKEDETKPVERNNKQLESEVNVIDVEDDHQESVGQTVIRIEDDGIVGNRNKKERIYHSEG